MRRAIRTLTSMNFSFPFPDHRAPMHALRTAVTVALASFLLTAATVRAAAELPPAGLAVGLKVGDTAPDFTLKSASGEDVTLKDLLAPGPIALVFFRSAEWCPYCRRQLEELQTDRARIEASGVRLVALSYDSPAALAAATAKLVVTYPLLSDAGSRVIDAYGVRNAEAKGRAAGVPHPAIFLIDQKGKIQAKLMRDGYRERPGSDEIVAAAKNLK